MTWLLNLVLGPLLGFVRGLVEDWQRDQTNRALGREKARREAYQRALKNWERADEAAARADADRRNVDDRLRDHGALRDDT